MFSANAFLLYGIIIYFFLLIFFHFSEFLLDWWFHKQPKLKAFLISPNYLIAQMVCFVEFFLGVYFLADWKVQNYEVFLYIGLVGVVIGQIIRLVSIYTAGKAFTHIIQVKKREEHDLVITGIYRWFRHPGYFGWFFWTLSTQIMLKNPISLILFMIWGWRFLSHRIQYEERFLEKFFGQAYASYRRQTQTWIPFIK